MVSDPLQHLPGQEKVLFERFTTFSKGMPLESVMGAAVNVLINAIRQNYALRAAAEQKIDELFGRAKQLLLANHYDTVTGRRRSVIPHDQILHMPYVMDPDVTRKQNGR
jgi:hypothetical protein